MATPVVHPATNIRPADDESDYSDIDPNPNRQTRSPRFRRQRRPVCSPRLNAIAQPQNRAYQQLYHQHGWVLDPLRAARIRRKLADINVLTLEELEDQLSKRARAERAAKRQEKRKQRQSFGEYSAAQLDDLFGRMAKHLTAKLMAEPPAKVKPLIVSAATKKLIDYAADVLDNAMEAQRRVGGVQNLTSGCPVMERDERQVRARIAQEVAMLAKQVFFDTLSGAGGDVTAR